MRPDAQKKFSVLLLGPAEAGKSALMATLAGRAAGDISATIGICCEAFEDKKEGLKGRFFDVSGQERFEFVRKVVIKDRKDSIVIVVDDLNLESILLNIKKFLSEIIEVLEGNCPPLGLIINHKPKSTVDVEKLHLIISTVYAQHFYFINHCSVIDSSYRDTLFHQIARVSGAPVAQHNAASVTSGSLLYETTVNVVGYFGSFFQAVPSILPPTTQQQSAPTDQAMTSM